MATTLRDLIESINADDLPTNEFTIEDKDPMVILGKLNEVIANLETLNSTINSSDSKANEALQKAIQAVADATQALSVANGIDAKATQALANAIEAVSTANTALSASNTALSTANTAISTANTALSSANSAVETAQSAETKADNAVSTANTASETATSAKNTSEGIDAKATTALSNSQTAVSTANTADTKATQALSTANTADATANTANDTANTANDTANTALANSSNALTTSNEANTKATTALNNSNNAINTANGADTKADTAITASNEAKTTANDAKSTAQDALNQVVAGLGTKVYRDTQLLTSLDIKPIEDDIADNTTAITALQNGKVDKVTGKQLSTEDFTTAEKNKLGGLNNYDDTQLQADITALQNALNGKVPTTRTVNNKALSSDITLSASDVGAITKANLLDFVYPVGSIYMSMNNTSPQTFLGGTWERIQDRFLLSAGSTYSAGTTGGEATHTLIIDEMPSHTHTQNSHTHTQSAHSHQLYSTGSYASNANGLKRSGDMQGVAGVATRDSSSSSYTWNDSKGHAVVSSVTPTINETTATNQNTGGGSAHNNMPPYLAVYMWKRTA